MKHPGVGLLSAIEDAYGLQACTTSRLYGGEEAVVWRIDTPLGAYVVMEYPQWRTVPELVWVHQLSRHLKSLVPETVVPLAAGNGRTLVVSTDSPVAVFPFIAGETLDKDDRHLRFQAARLLARLHAHLLTVTIGTRPRSGPEAPANWWRPPDAEEIVDPELDALVSELQAGTRRLIKAHIHGDYYRRNLLCRDGEIVGIIDWNDAHVDWLIQEVAWSTWEFCKNRAGDALLVDRAEDFVAAYTAAGGPGIQDAHDLILPFIRLRLRDEIRGHLAARARGLPGDADYASAERRAFAKLRDSSLMSA